MCICLHDAKCIYAVPQMLEEQNTSGLLNSRLNLNIGSDRPKDFMSKWKMLAYKLENLKETVSIALVGKYVQFEDAYTSVIKALQHAACMCNRKLDLIYVDSEDLEEHTVTEKPVKYFEAWRDVAKAEGIIVPGGFGPRGMEGKISVCKWARENGIPFLGICLGLQAAVIEFARNKLNWPEATSQEMNPESVRHVVIEMPEHNQGIMGGTMRLGKRQTKFTRPSKIRQLYGNLEYIEERHRHRYEVNLEYINEFSKAGMHFVGEDEKGERMEIMELDNHSYYVACQYHPEYLSRPVKPSPPYVGLILAAAKELDSYLARGCPPLSNGVE
ncbi:CTP synthase 1 [Armadillidium vulgare]|nr:CTP synthase 1 [Armadillidium vulgare]